MELAEEVREITGNSYDECLELSKPLAEQVIKTGRCELPDGREFTIEDYATKNNLVDAKSPPNDYECQANRTAQAIESAMLQDGLRKDYEVDRLQNG